MRLIGYLTLLGFGLGGAIVVDYRLTSRAAAAGGEAESLGYWEYVDNLSGRVSNIAGSASASAGGLPSRLADMLPQPPKGWSVRPAVPEDLAGFLPKNQKSAEEAAIAYVSALVDADSGDAAEAVALTYEKGERKVVIKLARYANTIFTGTGAMDQRLALQLSGAQYRGTEFMTVRGLDIEEDMLPEGFRSRYFLADVGGQIHLRVLAPKRMTDKELLPFFETLHVKAMNAKVVDRQGGLGEVPVIVLASALNETARADYVAGLAERKSRAETAYQAAFDQFTAEAAKAPAPAGDTGESFFTRLFGGGDAATEAAEQPVSFKTECKTDKDGVKRCAVIAAPVEE